MLLEACFRGILCACFQVVFHYKIMEDTLDVHGTANGKEDTDGKKDTSDFKQIARQVFTQT